MKSTCYEHQNHRFRVFRQSLQIPAITNKYQDPDFFVIQQYDITTRAKLVSTAMYYRNFKPKFFADITMLGKLFVAQILARKHKFDFG